MPVLFYFLIKHGGPTAPAKDLQAHEQMPSRTDPGDDLRSIPQKDFGNKIRADGVKIAGDFRPLELSAKERSVLALVRAEILSGDKG